MARSTPRSKSAGLRTRSGAPAPLNPKNGAAAGALASGATLPVVSTLGGLSGANAGAKGRVPAQRTRAAARSGAQTHDGSAAQRREADTRERILQAGAELVGAKGFNGCGLSEILARAKVPKGSFYHYFASKEDFGVALIERARDEYLASLREHLTDRRRSALGRLRSIFEDTRNECARTGPTVECLIPKLALETATLSAPVHAAVKCSYELWSAIIAQVVREGQAAGEIDAAHEPERLARVLVMLWEGAAVRMQIDRSIQPLDDFLAFVFDTLLRPEGRSRSGG